MSEIVTKLGLRIRNSRTAKNLSQEKLAELAGCHPTYIGQVERGEKNATVESIAKISAALGVPLCELFEKLDGDTAEKDNIPLKVYELLAAKSPAEQERLYRLICDIEKYKD